MMRKRKWGLAAAALLVIALAVCGGITIWMDPPVQYYGQWIRQHDLFERQINPVMCVQLNISDWYRRVARVFPAPSSFICFNTDAEARLWMQQNLP